VKIAILVHGQPRFTDYFYDFIENKLNCAEPCDWYFWLWDQTNQDDSRIPDWYTTNVQNNKLFQYINQKSHHIKHVSHNQLVDYNQAFETYPNKRTETVPYNVWFMLKSLYSANQAIKPDQQYDLVIKIRSDATLQDPIPLESCYNFVTQNPTTIITSHYHTYGFGVMPINDWFAIGNQKSMNIYCSVFPNLIKYCKAGLLLHPESLLASHLILNDIDWVYSNITIKVTGKN
jgi:hypothetical protein